MQSPYSSQIFKIPTESADYPAASGYVVSQIEAILSEAIANGRNKIIINTNLRRGIPMENVNKIAGPFVEAWAGELFEQIAGSPNNSWDLVNVESCRRLDMADVILQFRHRTSLGEMVSGNVDVKATAEDFANSGKSPNITSFERIRNAYVEDPDYIFIILSLKHKVYGERDDETGLFHSVMEIVRYSVYDLKYISEDDISYNPALGTGQIQIKDIHYVSTTHRNTWEFCQMIDRMYISSSKHTVEDWLELAKRNEWVK